MLAVEESRLMYSYHIGGGYSSCWGGVSLEYGIIRC
jgi:hypothetical protein